MYGLAKGTGTQAGTRGGFSLVELLAVVALMIILMSLMLPAVKSLVGSAGRRGAISQILGTFDNARVAALESGTSVYVGFADATFPEPDMRYRSYIVFRPRLDSDDPPQGTPGGSPYVFLTKWRRLPQGIAFNSRIEFSVLGSSGASRTIEPADQFPRIASGKIPVVEFRSHGGIAQPDSQHLRLFLYEGFYDSGADVVTRRQDELLDVIALARFTGRPRLEVSAAP